MNKDLVKVNPNDLAVEHGVHYLGLSDPVTGKKTDCTLSLEARWILQAILNSIIRAKGNELFTYSDGSFDPLTFRLTSTEVRKWTRPDFTNALQLRAFREVRQWLLIFHYEWIEEADQKGRWQRVKAERAKPFLVDSVILEIKPLGARRKTDKLNSQLELWGFCNPALGRVLQSNVFFQKVHLIPLGACRMKKGAQLILHQALPFVFRPSGFHMDFEFVGNLLGYDETTRREGSGQCIRRIDGYIHEIVKLTGWRHGKKGEGCTTTWHLYAGKQSSALDL